MAMMKRTARARKTRARLSSSVCRVWERGHLALVKHPKNHASLVVGREAR